MTFADQLADAVSFAGEVTTLIQPYTVYIVVGFLLAGVPALIGGLRRASR